MVLLGIGGGIAAGLLASWLWAIAPGRGGDFEVFDRYDYAHRGLHDLEPGTPENSLAAFKRAVERGYGVELDLQLTKDKKVVVHHDATLKRSCGADVRVQDLPYEALSEYRLFGSGERIPLFSEVLAVMGGKTPMIVELKGYNDPAELCTLAMKELEGYTGDYCVESFDPRIVRWFYKNRPEIVRGQLMYHMKKNENGLTGLQAFCGRNLLSNFHARPHFEAYDIHTRNVPSLRLAKAVCGLKEVSWTLRTQEEYDRAKRLNSLCIFEGFLPKEKK